MTYQNTELDNFIQAIPKLELPSEKDETTNSGAVVKRTTGNLNNEIKQKSVTRQFEKITALNPNSDVLWPGALIQGNSIQSGNLIPIAAKRAPNKISLSITNFSANPSKEIEDPSLSSVRDALNSILASQLPGSTPANISLDAKKVYSEDHLSLMLGGEVSTATVDIASKFNFNNSSIKSRYVVKFVQSFYTVDLDTPTHPSAFFAEEVDEDHLKSQMGDGNPPVYVSSITYGRYALFAVESKYSANETEFSLNASYKGLFTNASLDFQIDTARVRNESSIRGLILGGSANNAVQSINGVEGFLNYIQSNGDFSKNNPGIPIAYKLRYVADNSPAKMAISADYTQNDWNRVSDTVKVTLENFTCIADDDGGDDVELYGEFYANGEQVWAQDWKDHYVTVSKGKTIPVNVGKIIKITKESPTLKLSFHLKEDDDGSSEKRNDEFGTINKEWKAKDIPFGNVIFTWANNSTGEQAGGVDLDDSNVQASVNIEPA